MTMIAPKSHWQETIARESINGLSIFDSLSTSSMSSSSKCHHSIEIQYQCIDVIIFVLFFIHSARHMSIEMFDSVSCEWRKGGKMERPKSKRKMSKTKPTAQFRVGCLWQRTKKNVVSFEWWIIDGQRRRINTMAGLERRQRKSLFSLAHSPIHGVMHV